MSEDEHRTPAQQRRAKLDPETIAYLAELAEKAPPLSERQRDIIRAAFRAGTDRPHES